MPLNFVVVNEGVIIQDLETIRSRLGSLQGKLGGSTLAKVWVHL